MHQIGDIDDERRHSGDNTLLRRVGLGAGRSAPRVFRVSSPEHRVGARSGALAFAGATEGGPPPRTDIDPKASNICTAIPESVFTLQGAGWYARVC